jgi:hypothetical protein
MKRVPAGHDPVAQLGLPAAHGVVISMTAATAPKPSSEDSPSVHLDPIVKSTIAAGCAGGPSSAKPHSVAAIGD